MSDVPPSVALSSRDAPVFGAPVREGVYVCHLYSCRFARKYCTRLFQSSSAMNRLDDLGGAVSRACPDDRAAGFGRATGTGIGEVKVVGGATRGIGASEASGVLIFSSPPLLGPGLAALHLPALRSPDVSLPRAASPRILSLYMDSAHALVDSCFGGSGGAADGSAGARLRAWSHSEVPPYSSMNSAFVYSAPSTS